MRTLDVGSSVTTLLTSATVIKSHCAEAVGVLRVQEAPVAPFAEGTATSRAPASDKAATGAIQLRSLRIAIDTSFASEAQRLSEGV